MNPPLLAFLATLSIHLLDLDKASKTSPMMQELNADLFPDYDKEKELFLHDGISFHVLKGSNSSHSLEPTACMGAAPASREIILLDPHNSPLLNEKFEELLVLLQGSSSTEQTLQILCNFIRTKVFTPSLSTAHHLELFIKEHSSPTTLTKNGEPVPVIVLDEFIKAGIGVCRHQALVSAYFLDKLLNAIPPLLPPGKVHYIRDIITQGGHAWNFYVPQNSLERWHVDPLWNIVKNSSCPQERELLNTSYGKRAIDREILRFTDFP